MAVVIPCYNEEQTVEKVISDFKSSAPNAEIYVIDNNSTDATAERAEASGAHVIHERRQGKGYAVQRMFESVEADIYVMVDGDDAFSAEDIHGLTRAIASGRADMAIGNRRAAKSDMPTIRRLGKRADRKPRQPAFRHATSRPALRISGHEPRVHSQSAIGERRIRD